MQSSAVPKAIIMRFSPARILTVHLLTSFLATGIAPIALAQSAPTCTVTGQLFRPSGAPAAGETLFIDRAYVDGVPDGSFTPFSVTADANGSVSFAVPQGDEVAVKANNVVGLNNYDGVLLEIPAADTASLPLLWTRQAGVTSFNNRAGDVALLASDISNALGYMPYNNSNPAGFAPLVSPTFTTPNIGAATGTSLTLADGNALRFTQTTPGLGQTQVSAGEAVFGGTNDPVVYFGYNQNFNGVRPLSSESSVVWGAEGNYNDGSGQNKMEAYLQYTSTNGSTAVRPVFTQFNKVTNVLTNLSLNSNTINMNLQDGNTKMLSLSQGLLTLAPNGAGGNTVLQIQAPAGRAGQLQLAYGSNNTRLTLFPGSNSATITLGSQNALRLYDTPNGGSGAAIAVGVDDNSAAAVIAANGTATTALKVRQESGSSANIMEVQDSGRNVLAGFSSTGGLIGRRNVKAKTSAYSIPTTESNTVYTNTGAVAPLTFTLPSASVPGLTYTFSVEVAQTLSVTASGVDTIRLAGASTVGGGRLSSNVAGNVLTLVSTQTGKWTVIAHEGTWTVQ